MRKLVIASLLILFCQVMFAQSALKGTIKDTLEKKPLQNAVVTLLQKKDSSIYKFSRSDKSGNFLLADVLPGTYVLLITYPKFADYADEVTVKNETADLGLVALTEKSQLLQTVIIKNTGAIRIKGDTTEFVADSFKVREGATVEELLKKLPGFQVNSKGEITAQGQKVQKVLVDGEEFFGDDPTMATKNIGAKAVDKVQVFDTKTDQQQLTGTTTGSEGKTVNIKLKEDQKKGGFGRYSAATDFNKYHEVNLLYNRFVGKKKLSLYGNKTNTSTGSLNWEDQRKLGLENDFEFDEVGGYYFSLGNDDGFNNWNLRGLPDAYTAGGLYSNRFAADKQFLSGSYRYNKLATENQGSLLTQNILPDTLFYTNQYTTQHNRNEQHAFNGKWEWKPDSLTTIKFTTATTRKTTAFSTATNTESLSEEKAFVNTGNRINEGTTSRLQTDNSLQYKRLFKKAGRQLIGRLRFNYIEDEQTSVLRFTNNFYKANRIDSIEQGDQQKLFSGHSNTIGAKITYVEPLTKTWSLVGDYSYNSNAATSNRNTYDKSASGKYETRNALLSNNFDMQAQSNAGTLLAKYSTKKINLNIGNGFSLLHLKLHNKDNAKDTGYHFLNLMPQANIRYTFKQNHNLSLRYSGNSIQPSLEQLQPLRNNNDPLNIYLGNPNLKVGFQNRYNLNYNFYKVLSQTGMWMSATFTTINNAIAYATTIDAGGRKISQPVNVDGNNNWNLYFNYDKDGGPKKVHPRLSLNGNGGRNTNFVNSLQNRTVYYNINGGIGARYEVEDKWNVDISPTIGFNHSISTLNKGATTSYVSYETEINAFTKLPGHFEITTDANINLVPRINAFAGSNNITLWNAELSRKILKKGAGKLSIVAHDILNNNRGVERNFNSNFVSDERYLRVSRYFLLKFEWTFNKMGGGDE